MNTANDIVTNFDKRSFEYEGGLDTMSGHCRHFGIDYNKVKNAKYQYGLSAIESLEFAREKPKVTVVLKDFICELCKKPTLMKDESLMTGKCSKCYFDNYLMMRA